MQTNAMKPTDRLVKLPYGRRSVAVCLPATCLLQVLQVPPTALQTDPAEAVRQALARPIGCPPLRDLVRPGERVVIVTSDATRPCPSNQLLPPVLEELWSAGVAEQSVTVVMALGLHRPMTSAEIERAVSPVVAAKVPVINHDPTDVVRLGITSRGTPVELFRPVVEADRRICLGNLELHWFAGFSGGAKAILPGCASAGTIQANHALMAQPGVAAGRLDGNPVRADLEEGTALVGVDLILNVLLDGRHQISQAVAGDVNLAHRCGCQWVADRGIVPIAQPADLVLVSAGGHPKDINLYQAQKALDNAVRGVRPGGIVVLLAECSEGFGNSTFESWMLGASGPAEILQRIQERFALGGHKAAGFATALQRARVYLVSDLPPEQVRRCSMVPFTDAASAIIAALGELDAFPRVLVLSEGGMILPRPAEGPPATL
jgi:nickel-dependent lactate racemase